MCTLTFIDLPGADQGVCDYLLAKFIIFCVFGGVALLYSLLGDPINPNLFCQLIFTAVAFEVVALLVGMLYLAGVIILATEILSFLFVCGCCWLTIPLTNRAIARGTFDGNMDYSCVFTILTGVVCNECIHIMLASHGTSSSPEDRPANTEIQTTPPQIAMIPTPFATQDRAVVEKIRLVAELAHTGINMM